MELKFKLSTSDILKGIRCLKASEKIKKGEVIERCPVVLVPSTEIEHLSKTVLTYYEFIWNAKNEAVALGYGSLYNHSDNPNVAFAPNYRQKLMVFTALRDIEVDEELFIDYQQGDTKEKIDPGHIDYKH